MAHYSLLEVTTTSSRPFSSRPSRSHSLTLPLANLALEVVAFFAVSDGVASIVKAQQKYQKPRAPRLRIRPSRTNPSGESADLPVPYSATQRPKRTTAP